MVLQTVELDRGGFACALGGPRGPSASNMDDVTELPIDDVAAFSGAARDAAERGQVVYLVGPDGRRLAAIVPANVAAAGAAALEALEDADDLAAAEAALAEWEADDRRTYRLANIDAELGGN